MSLRTAPGRPIGAPVEPATWRRSRALRVGVVLLVSVFLLYGALQREALRPTVVAGELSSVAGQAAIAGASSADVRASIAPGVGGCNPSAVTGDLVGEGNPAEVVAACARASGN